MPECFIAKRSSDLNVDQTTYSNVESSSDSFKKVISFGTNSLLLVVWIHPTLRLTLEHLSMGPCNHY